jgi:hypothetical protein
MDFVEIQDPGYTPTIMPDQEASIADLRPLFPAVVRAAHRAMHDYRAMAEFAAKRGAPIPPRARAPLFQGFVVERAKPLLKTLRGTHVRYEKDRKSQELFVVGDGDYAVVFKKSVAGLACNHRSGNQDELRESGQMCLGFGERAGWLVFLIEVDETWTQILDVRLISPKRYAGNNWNHPVLDEVRGTDPSIGSLFEKAASEPKPATAVESDTKIKRRKKSS